MSLATHFRTIGAIALLGGALAVLGKSLLAPEPLDPAPTPVSIAVDSPFQGWEKLSGNPDPNFPNTTRYRHENPGIELEVQFIPDLPVHYIRNSMLEMRFIPRGHLPLDAGMRFYVNSRARVIANLQSDPPSEALVETRVPSPTSAYGIWTGNERLHLSTVVTPAGDASMATRRVARSLYLDQVSLTRVWNWLLGREMLPDRRCVLVHFSVPAAQDGGRQILEDAWKEWQGVLQTPFPK